MSTNKQPKTLTTSVESQTTVEGALGALSTNKATQAEVNDIVNVYGAKNLLQYPYYSTTKTISGITITDNGDGTLTLDGTATARISYDITSTASYNLLEIGKKYFIGFKASDDTIDSNSWALRIYCKKDSTTVLSVTDSRGSDVAFTVPEETIGSNVQFIIVRGTVLSNVVIKPMIRLSSIQDNTYVPYAKTNKELTNDLTVSNVDISYTVNMPAGSVFAKKYGNVVEIQVFDISPVQELSTSTQLATIGILPVNMCPKDKFFKYMLLDGYIAPIIAQFSVASDGSVSVGFTTSGIDGSVVNFPTTRKMYIDETFII